MNNQSTKSENEAHEASTGGETETDTIVHERADIKQSEAPTPDNTATDIYKFFQGAGF